MHNKYTTFWQYSVWKSVSKVIWSKLEIFLYLPAAYCFQLAQTISKLVSKWNILSSKCVDLMHKGRSHRFWLSRFCQHRAEISGNTKELSRRHWLMNRWIVFCWFLWIRKKIYLPNLRLIKIWIRKSWMIEDTQTTILQYRSGMTMWW